MGFVTDLRNGRKGLDFTIPYGPELWRAVRDYPGRFYSKINTVIQFLEADCGSKWFVYVQTALPAVGELVLALVDFDWDDVARGFIRPYGPRTRAGLRLPSKGKIRLPDLPEVGEEIGKRIPGARIIKARAVHKLEKWFWVVDGVLQKLLFWWMILDLSATFFYHWALGIFHTSKCSGSGYGGMWNKRRPKMAWCHDWGNVPIVDSPDAFVEEAEAWGNYMELSRPYNIGHPSRSVTVIYEYGYYPGLANPTVRIGVFDARTDELLEYHDVVPGVNNVLAYTTYPGQLINIRNQALCEGLFPFYWEKEHYVVAFIR